MWAYNLPSGSNNQNMSVNSLTLSNIASGAHFTPEQLAQVSFRPASPDAANLSFNAAQLGANANFNLQHGFQHGQGHSQAPARAGKGVADLLHIATLQSAAMSLQAAVGSTPAALQSLSSASMCPATPTSSVYSASLTATATSPSSPHDSSRTSPSLPPLSEETAAKPWRCPTDLAAPTDAAPAPAAGKGTRHAKLGPAEGGSGGSRSPASASPAEYPSDASSSPPAGAKPSASVASLAASVASLASIQGVNKIIPRRKAGQRERTSTTPVVLDEATLTKLFSIPLHQAAASLGISATALKSACRKLGVHKWPFRAVQHRSSAALAKAAKARARAPSAALTPPPGAGSRSPSPAPRSSAHLVSRGDGAGAPHSLAALNALGTAALLHQDAAKQSQRALSPELQRDAALLAETLLMLHSGQQGAASPRAAAPLEQPPASSKEEPRIEGGNIPVSFLLSA